MLLPTQRTCFWMTLLTLMIVQCSNVSAQSMGNPGVAVLNDGRIFEGTITEVPGGYRVGTSNGHQLVLPFDQISVTSASLVGAYESMRDSMKVPSAEGHLSLAEWCIVNGLWAQAYAEVQSALKLEPQRSDALKMLQRIDAYVLSTQRLPDGNQAEGNRVTPASATMIKTASPGRAPDEQYAPRPSRVVFQTKIQPILMSRCANGACHGQIAKNAFRLTNVRMESRNLKMATESNLEVLKDWIDSTSPAQSPLLKKPLEETRHHRALFIGQNREQYVALQNWVIQFAREQAASGESASTSSTSSAVQPAAGIVSSPVREPGRLPDSPVKAMPGAPVPSGQPVHQLPSETQSPELKAARRHLQPDAFDPTQFNRMTQPTAAP